MPWLARSACCLLLLVDSLGAAFGQAVEFGKNEYLNSCGPCHGISGKGDGPVAKSLNTPPTDLSTLARKNDGEFPILRLYSAIDGRAAIAAHGTRDMPVWGETFRRELRYPGSALSKETVDSIVRDHILALIEYISTLQRK